MPKCLGPTTANSEDVLVESEGRCGRAGRDNSGYVIAGIVPPPIQPLLLLLLLLVLDVCRVWASVALLYSVLASPTGVLGLYVASSWRETLSASSRSILSLHCNSSFLRLSINALSVSDLAT